MPLTQEELDHVYELPYEGTYHPVYEAEGGVPAIEEVEFSITHNRGCFGRLQLLLHCFPSGKGDYHTERRIGCTGSGKADSKAKL